MICLNLRTSLNNYFQKPRMCPALTPRTLDEHSTPHQAPCRRVRGTRLHYQQFEYTTSGTDYELYDAMLPIPTYPQDLEQPAMLPDLLPESADQDPVSNVSFQDCLPQVFSDHEPLRSLSPQLTLSDDPPALSLTVPC